MTIDPRQFRVGIDRIIGFKKLPFVALKQGDGAAEIVFVRCAISSSLPKSFTCTGPLSV
ncbi:hypothetical protein ACR9HH_16390 [Enterobacter mori]